MAYQEILVDHTSLHVFRPERELSGQSLSFRTREMLQFIDAFLLSDVMWLCDTVTPQTMAISQAVIDKLAEHGLTTPRSDGKFRLTRFTIPQIEQCCVESAANAYDSLFSLNDSAFVSYSESNHYLVRPKGAQDLAFPEIASIPYDSQQSQDFITTAMATRGWGPMSAIPLLNADLYQWIADFVVRFPDANHPVYNRLNTILRWRFNEVLSIKLSLSGKTQCDVNYTPALGRAITIKELSLRQWTNKLSELAWPQNAMDILSTLHPNKKISLPILGFWIMSSLKEDCTIDDLLERLADVSFDRDIIAYRRWLATADHWQTAQTMEQIDQDLPRIIHQASKGKTRIVQTIQHEFVLPLPLLLSNIKLVSKFDQAASTWEEKMAFVKSIFPAPNARTILSGLLSDTLRTGIDESGLSRRTASILRSMKPLSNVS